MSLVAVFSPLQIGVGLILALIISLFAYRFQALSRSGAIAATLLGGLIFGLGGLPWAILLLGFFITSTFFSRLARTRKATLGEKYAKDDRRDAWQVLANGGITGLAVILYAWQPTSLWPWLAGAAALAAANADTWATELGVLSAIPPRRILDGQHVEPGSAGGITPLGLLAALGGATVIAMLAALLPPPSLKFQFPTLAVLLIIALSGLLGSLVDSLLGASVQAMYYCPACRKETERHPLHACGEPTTHLRGWPWLTNDSVNAACTLSAALLAGVMGLTLHITPALPSAARVTPKPTGLFLSSPAFSQGNPIPARHTCDGEDLSPALTWQTASEVASYALIVEDPDAPLGTFTHWILYNIPPGRQSLPEGLPVQETLPGIGVQGRNDFGQLGYGGPCPPPGPPHRYRFTLFGLNLPPTLPNGLDRTTLLRAIGDHILFSAILEGLYSR
ncbi:YbhB/YbcL family Raf kinase inhibitor-like protein [uncultured Thermanaerothrix sp.]|uniref:YbhB/YbcL family Raf kinase inhibitor-like protein n=1 Tax=uncultured Thermanaerothrix sp. TaxID=1195149 RepID=UPI0026319E23|nr:YbhB/YbcL family Raf kinase inhibitor-like protein [uncultured Thermanaerothrix sp.]